MRLNVEVVDMTETHVAVYVSHRHGLVTTSCMFGKGQDDLGLADIRRQLDPYIKQVECISDDERMIVSGGVTGWNVGVSGRFTPLGEIKVLAMLDPG